MELWGLHFDFLFWFCASGKTFFAGLILLATALICFGYIKNNKSRFAFVFCTLLGIVFIWLSATPNFISAWVVYGIALGLLSLIKHIRTSRGILRGVHIAAVVLCLLPGLAEYRYWRMPVVSLQNINTICVIGDSVSAGIGGPDEMTWTKLLSNELKIPIVNLAIAGATAESALRRQVPRIENQPGLIFIEIGGNDILNATAPDIFETAMRKMCGTLKTSTNQIIWFELPLLPGKTGYGRIQRKLADEMHITLVPKKFLSDVFCTPEATSDTIHLTAKGHQLFARKVYRLFNT